jgi:hypothetical protein
MTFRRLACVGLGILVLVGFGGSGGDDGRSARAAQPVTSERLRELILRGVDESFRPVAATAPEGFGLCLRRGLRERLGREELARLVARVRETGGRRVASQAIAAQALNGLAAPVGDGCGDRRFVPQLVAAAAPLATAASTPYAFSSRRYALEGTLPAGWRPSRERLVKRLIAPREVLSVGTFPMPPGSGGNCGREPAAAIRRMGADDVLITIQEYSTTAKTRATLRRRFPPLPSGPGIDRLERAWVAAERGVVHATIPFGEAGRALEALVYFGRWPGGAERREVAEILAGIRFDRAGAFHGHPRPRATRRPAA